MSNGKKGRPFKAKVTVDPSQINTNLFLLNHDFEPDNSWLNIGPTDSIEVPDNPLLVPENSEFYRENPGFWEIHKLTDPEYIGYTAWVLLGLTLLPYQQVILKNMWTHPFTMLIASRGGSKSFCLAVYSLLRCLLYPEYKVVITSGGFRQSKMVFEELEKIWSLAPVYRSIAGPEQGPHHDPDRWVFRVNNSTITAIPTGSGDKIRGLRANTIFLDEFASQDPRVVEEVIMGFGAVSSNMIENVKNEARRKYFEENGIQNIPESTSHRTNQAIFCGTADYYDNHFYSYWRRQRAIIESKGDPKKLEKIFNGAVPAKFNWKDYCLIRLPYSLLPQGYMEDTVVARSKSSMAKSLYLKEYEAIFVEDSEGFFKRSVIEGCTCSDSNINSGKWSTITWCPQPFEARIKGDAEKRYVMGIDPASESDNLAIMILEVHPEHQRIVHSWTTNRKNFELRRKSGTTQCEDYYHFVVRKVRDLMKAFNIVAIGIDMQGGGLALYEAMHTTNALEMGEQPLWFIRGEEKRDCDDYPGLHIVHDIQFIRYDWTVKVNYDLLKDMETRCIIFPRFDPITIELSAFEDKKRFGMAFESTTGTEIYDTFESVIMEIEKELKNELTSIQLNKAGTRLKWTVPPTSSAENNKKLVSGKKDRYSALLIANSLARIMRAEVAPQEYSLKMRGGLLNEMKARKGEGLYDGPEWFTGQFGV